LLLDIVTITKDDVPGLDATLVSTQRLREDPRVRQTVIDSSGSENAKECAALATSGGAQYYWTSPAGVARAFNEGLKRAAAEWVWFLNGGDRVNADLSTRFLLEYLNRSRAHVVIGQVEYAQSRVIPSHPPIWALWPPIICWIPHPATIVRRTSLNDLGGFDERLSIAADYDLWFRLCGSRVTTDVVSIPFAVFDETGLSTSADSRRRMAKEALSVLRRHWAQIARQQLRLPLQTIRDSLYWLRRS
jgi:hypothetical protein